MNHGGPATGSVDAANPLDDAVDGRQVEDPGIGVKVSPHFTG
jgi:hypothetical protein